MAGTPDDGSTRSVFRLLCDEYTLFLRRTGSSKSFADRLVEKYLGEGERDRDGRIRYKILEIHALPGGLTPSPYDGDFWHSYPERNIRCEISSWDSSAHWTGPASAVWREFDGRETADYKIIGIKLNHDIVLEFLDSAGLHERTQSDKPSQKSSAAPTKAPAQIKAKPRLRAKPKPRPNGERNASTVTRPFRISPERNSRPELTNIDPGSMRAFGKQARIIGRALRCQRATARWGALSTTFSTKLRNAPRITPSEKAPFQALIHTDSRK